MIMPRESVEQSSCGPYWIVTHHPIMRPDGTRVPARARALYCPATNRVLFGAAAEAAAEIGGIVTTLGGG
jgi:hypothetical protein